MRKIEIHALYSSSSVSSIWLAPAARPVGVAYMYNNVQLICETPYSGDVPTSLRLFHMAASYTAVEDHWQYIGTVVYRPEGALGEFIWHVYEEPERVPEPEPWPIQPIQPSPSLLPAAREGLRALEFDDLED